MWFFECEHSIVHKEEAHLIPTPNPDNDGAALMEVEDNDGDALGNESIASIVHPKTHGVKRMATMTVKLLISIRLQVAVYRI